MTGRRAPLVEARLLLEELYGAVSETSERFLVRSVLERLIEAIEVLERERPA